MPDYSLYKKQVKFLISNKAETATDKVNAFLETLNPDDILEIRPLIVSIGVSDRRGYLVGAMVTYLELKEPSHVYDKGIDFGAGMDCPTN